MASFSRSPFIPKSVTLNSECKNDPVVLELKGINNNMRKIDAYVVLGLKGKKKQLEDQRKRDTDSKRREKKLFKGIFCWLFVFFCPMLLTSNPFGFIPKRKKK